MTSSSDAAKLRDEIFNLQEKLQRAGESSHGDGDSGSDDDDESDVVVTSFVLESTLVPALKDLLKDQDESLTSSLSAPNSFSEERKDASETSNDAAAADDEDRARTDRVAYTEAILECLASFAAATCAAPASNRDVPSPVSSYNSLSFKRNTTTTVKPKYKTPKKAKPISLSTPREDKLFFVTCGAFEMAVYLLRVVLEDHTKKVSSSSWSKHKRSALDTFDSIGVEDSVANVQIESTLPTNKIPILVMNIVACLTHNACDTLKNDRILPHLKNIVHQSMMIFLPSAEVQRYGCWTLKSLSNPLLQELIAAGSVSILVKAMKCHPCDVGVQEHGNNALYNLLPLLTVCYKNRSDSPRSNGSDSMLPMNQDSNHSSSTPPPSCGKIEIDGKQLEDYSSLVPSLPAIVLRGMEEHPDHLAVQQYGLLVLTRLCQQDQETYEIVVSEGGLTALLNVVSMATTHTYSALADTGSGRNSRGAHTDCCYSSTSTQSIAERHDCLAQMACQFLRDLSRPTNSSMDILRIIAVKGGTQTVLGVLDHYNKEHIGGGHAYHAHHNRFAVNIIDPAMACLRNLMTNEDNRSEIMTLSKQVHAARQQAEESGSPKHQLPQASGSVEIVPIVLATMDLYPLDAAIQAYGCDLLGRLTQGEELARMELIESTIVVHAQQNEGGENEERRSTNGRSRLWNRSTTEQVTGDESLEQSLSSDGAEMIDLSDKFGSMMGSSSSDSDCRAMGGSFHGSRTGTVDSLVTVVRAMMNHRSHSGVQERSVVLLLAMVLDRSAIVASSNTSSFRASASPSASSYLIQRLQEVYEGQLEQRDGTGDHTSPSFLSFLQSTSVTPKGAERLKKLIQVVEDYDRKTKRASISVNSRGDGGEINGRVGTFLARRWNKLTDGLAQR